MSRSKHSPDEKLQAVLESLDHNTTEVPALFSNWTGIASGIPAMYLF